MLLLPEVDETVGGFRDGSERPNGGVADPDRSFVVVLLHIVIIQQIDDIPDAAAQAEYLICSSVFKDGFLSAHPGWSLDPLGLASVNTPRRLQKNTPKVKH